MSQYGVTRFQSAGIEARAKPLCEEALAATSKSLFFFFLILLPIVDSAVSYLGWVIVGVWPVKAGVHTVALDYGYWHYVPRGWFCSAYWSYDGPDRTLDFSYDYPGRSTFHDELPHQPMTHENVEGVSRYEFPYRWHPFVVEDRRDFNS